METKNSDKSQLMQYTGMGLQFLVSIGIGVFVGLKADDFLNISIPLFVWLLPLLIIFGLTYKFIKDTSKKK